MVATSNHGSQVKRTGNSETNNSPSGSDDGLIRELPAGIPDQVTNAVPAVEGEGHGNDELGSYLEQHRPGTKGGGHRGALEVPAEERSGEVGGAEDVHAAGERGARDTVQTREVPGDLWAVDGEMGRGGTVLALGNEDLIGILRRHPRRRDGSGSC
jgi:hypothetical protein